MIVSNLHEEAAHPTGARMRKARGIPFSDPMVRALLDGRKSITRRLVKRPKGFSDAVWNAATPHNEGDGGLGIFGSAPYLRVWADDDTGRLGERIRCPYGIVGDELWCKEALVREDDDFLATYAIDGALVRRDERAVRWPWKPRKLAAMYCPRWASRITLEITSVRVERLHQITEQDAIAEGIEPIDFPRETFAALWDSINGKRSPWNANDFVWRIAFRRLA